jgi:hypothetical protein
MSCVNVSASGSGRAVLRALADLERLLAGLSLGTGGQRRAEPVAEDHAAGLPLQDTASQAPHLVSIC